MAPELRGLSAPLETIRFTGFRCQLRVVRPRGKGRRQGSKPTHLDKARLKIGTTIAAEAAYHTDTTVRNRIRSSLPALRSAPIVAKDGLLRKRVSLRGGEIVVGSTDTLIYR